MLKRLLVAGVPLIAIFAFLFIKYFSISTSPDLQNKSLSKQDRIDLAIAQEVALTKDPASGQVPRERLVEALRLRDQIRNNANFRTDAAVPNISWVERGPSNVGGRTRALMFDLNDAANGYKKVWAGSVSGGLWFTNDITVASPVWNKVNDLMDNLAVCAIVQNPLNPQEMYMGTGEGWFNSDAVKGLGIWKSSNGGTTWTRLLSTANFGYINDLLIDKNGHLYASVRPTVAGDPFGIQKSVNGGNDWVQVLGTNVFGSSSRGGDLELGATGDVFASLGTSGSNGGIYMSSFATHSANTGNAGTFVNITPTATGDIAAPASLWQRIELATAPSDANIMYALFQGTGSNNCTSIQQYNKGTNTWSVKTVPLILDQNPSPTSNFTRGQAWYDLIAAVDPLNANSFYIGGVDALRSDDAGATWTQMTAWSLFAATGFTAAQNVHADHHAIVFAPNSSGKALWGTDGGVYYTTNANSAVPQKPSFGNKNTGYNVTQYYACAIHPTLPNYFLAGAQDNGTQKFNAAGINITTNASGGDGAFCHIDKNNGNIQITSYVYNNYYVSLDGGASFQTKSFANTGSFINPTDYDDAGNILYGGNSAGTFFRWNDPAAGGSSFNNVSCAAFGGASVTHVAASSTVPNRVYFGLSNGSVVMVDGANAGSSVAGTVIKTGAGSVSGIAIDEASANHILVTYSNYGVVSVFETTNANAATPTWTAVEGNLPDMPVRWVIFDPRNSDWSLIATEVGIWSTDNLNGSSTDWQPTNGGLANVRVDMLQFRALDNTIAAATHGRGLFTTVVPPAGNVVIPNIGFGVTTTSVTEVTDATATCRRYKDYTVNITTSAAPIGDAILTYAVQTPSTAVSGIDYDITTNGDFASPSLTHTFTNGAVANKTLTIRIYDDAEVEVTESFTIKATLSGNTNALLTGDTHTVTITDNDAVPVNVTVIASALTAKTEYQAANIDLYYYNAAGEIIARIRNLSTQNFGCTQIAIDRAGTSALPFWNAAPNNYLASKTFKVTPATNNATGKYEITLYFTEAEKQGWESVTGRSWNNIQIVKTPDAINNVSAVTPPAVQIVDPTKREKLGNNYTLTATFETGFSGFGVGVPGVANAAPVVFPNPFRDQISIRFPQNIAGSAVVSIYDITGRLIHQSRYAGAATNYLFIDVKNLGLISRAIYIVEVVADGKRHTVKVQKG